MDAWTRWTSCLMLLSVTPLLAAGSPPPLKTFPVDDSHSVLFVCLSPDARTLVYCLDSNTESEVTLYWCRGPEFSQRQELRLSGRVVAWDLSRDGRWMAIAFREGVVRVVELSPSPAPRLHTLSIPRVTDDGEPGTVKSASLRWLSSTQGTRELLVCSGGMYRPATLYLFDLAAPNHPPRTRPIDGMVVTAGGTWDRPIISNLLCIRRDTAERKVIYGLMTSYARWKLDGDRGIYVSYFCSWYNCDYYDDAPLTIGVWDVESGKLLGWRNITAKSLAAFPVLSADRKTLYILRTSGRLMRWNYATNTTEHWDIGPNSEWDLGLNSHALAVSGSTAYVATSSDHAVTLIRIAIPPSD